MPFVPLLLARKISQFKKVICEAIESKNENGLNIAIAEYEESELPDPFSILAHAKKVVQELQAQAGKKRHTCTYIHRDTHTHARTHTYIQTYIHT